MAEENKDQVENEKMGEEMIHLDPKHYPMSMGNAKVENEALESQTKLSPKEQKVQDEIIETAASTFLILVVDALLEGLSGGSATPAVIGSTAGLASKFMKIKKLLNKGKVKKIVKKGGKLKEYAIKNPVTSILNGYALFQMGKESIEWVKNMLGGDTQNTVHLDEKDKKVLEDELEGKIKKVVDDSILFWLNDVIEKVKQTSHQNETTSDKKRKEFDEMNVKLDALLKAMQLEKNEEGEYHLQKHEIKGLSHLSDEDKAEANRRNNIPTRMEMADFFEKLDGKMTGRLALIQMKLDQSWGGAINENWLEKLYDAFRDDDRFEWFFQEFFYQEWTKITMHFNYDNDDELI